MFQITEICLYFQEKVLDVMAVLADYNNANQSNKISNYDNFKSSIAFYVHSGNEYNEFN